MKAVLVSLCTVIALFGCDGRTLPVFNGITRVEVRTNHDSLGSIVDSQQIARIVAFANARREKWTQPWAGVPIGTLGVTFFAGRNVQGSFSAGDDFFEAQQDGNWFSRNATPAEVAEWRAMFAAYAPAKSK
jgi:hypothetical protein